MEHQGIFSSSFGKHEDAAIEGGDHSVVVSVVENRAREICICKIDTQSVSSLYSSIMLMISNWAILLLLAELVAGNISVDR